MVGCFGQNVSLESRRGLLADRFYLRELFGAHSLRSAGRLTETVFRRKTVFGANVPSSGVRINPAAKPRHPAKPVPSEPGHPRLSLPPFRTPISAPGGRTSSAWRRSEAGSFFLHLLFPPGISFARRSGVFILSVYSLPRCLPASHACVLSLLVARSLGRSSSSYGGHHQQGFLLGWRLAGRDSIAKCTIANTCAGAQPGSSKSAGTCPKRARARARALTWTACPGA